MRVDPLIVVELIPTIVMDIELNGGYSLFPRRNIPINLYVGI